MPTSEARAGVAEGRIRELGTASCSVVSRANRLSAWLETPRNLLMKLHPLTDHDCCPHCGGRLSAATATAGESDEDVYPCPACGRQVAHCLSPDGSCYL